MALSIFLPLDQLRPGEFISQYSDWIYFTLTLAFMAATIPYGLCRGFGLSGAKAFYLTYILFYVLAWVKFPQVFYALGDANMGLLNLALLILFLVSVYKVAWFGRGSGSETVSRLKGDLGSTRESFEPEIRHELETEKEEEGIIKTRGLKLTEAETRTAEDIKARLQEILQIIETHANSLGNQDRAQISRILSRIADDEKIFLDSVENARALFKRLEAVDKAQLHEKLHRLKNLKGKDRKILEAEIKLEEEKIRLEEEIRAHENELRKFMESLNQYLALAVETVAKSAYPLDAVPHLKNAEKSAGEIISITKHLKTVEERLLAVIKAEEKAIKRERRG